MQKAIRRGDLFCADLNPVVRSEQGGIRPILIVQNNVGNHFSPTIVAAAIASRKVKRSLPTHVLLDNVPGTCPYFAAALGAAANNRSKAASWLHWAYWQGKNARS